LATAAPAAVDILAPAASVTVLQDGRTQTFATLAEAMVAATTGAVVRLAPGTHRGPVVLRHPGMALRGEPGARIDANAPDWKPQWTKAPQYGRLSFIAPIPFAPGAVSVDDRLMIDARESRGGMVLHDGGLGNDSRMPLQGVYTYLEKDQRLVVSFADGADPSGRRIAASPRGVTAVAVRGADRCRVEGLIVTGGETGIGLEETTGSVVDRCLVYAEDVCVRLGSRASACNVLSCDLTMNPDALNLDCDPMAVGKAVWHAHKRVGTYDKWGVLADQAGTNNEVAFNYVYNAWDGIENLTGVGKDDVAAHYTNHVYKGIAPFNRGLKVHHNRIDLTMDDGLEPNDQVVDNEWFANRITRARCAVRIKTISLGPFHVYDNVVLDSGTGLRLYKSSPACANVYIFNNVIRDETGIVYLQMDSVCWDDPWLAATMPRGTPGFRIFNNVFLCSTPFANQEANVPPNFVSNHNLFTAAPTAAEFPPKGSDGRSLFDAAPTFADVTNGNWRLAAGSPGKGAGCALSTFCPAVPSGAAAFAVATSPDMGLLGVAGERPLPLGPTSGLWELAAKTINLGERDVSQFSLDPTRFVPLHPLWGRKDGKKEIGRFSSAKCGVEERELTIEFSTADATSITVLCRFSQESAGETVWFSDLRLVALPAE
jgi:hypothetical protein